MSTTPEISFGARVRVRSDFLTNQLGLAESIGQVYGESTPSVTEFEVIGKPTEDRAINVFFKERNEAYWFAPHLLEFIDHGPGTEITIGDAPKKWVRTATGEWVESGLDESAAKRPWWKFWTSV